jgi:DNA uptake protein ComE-like DNA-binding protein
MSSMVDSRSEAVQTMCTRCGDAGLFDSLVKGRFVALAAVVTAALGLGFGGGGGEESPEAAVAEMPGLRLDPNTVPPQVLTALPHVGSSLVDRWVKAREERPFESLEDARSRVRGLGPATLEQIGPYFELPDGRRQVVESTVSQEAGGPRTMLRTASRKKPGSTKKRAAQPAGLASRPVRPSDL